MKMMMRKRSPSTVAALALLSLARYSHAFTSFLSFARRNVPSRKMEPRRQHSNEQQPAHFTSQSASSSTTLAAALTEGDTVLVIGGTGGVGQLVTGKLSSLKKCPVRVTTRNVESEAAQAVLENNSAETAAVSVVPLQLVQDSAAAMQAQLQAALADVSGVVISVGTTAFPTTKWAGGNTPKAIDAEAVTRIVKAIAATSSVKRVAMVTSVGVDRTDEMPFLILNLFGVLDAKKEGEEALKAAASSDTYEYTIVRPGRLVGGPFTNLDVAKLLQVQGGAENGVAVAPGDDLLGDCKRDACAEAIVQALFQDGAGNTDFSIISTEEAALTDDEWKQAFEGL